MSWFVGAYVAAPSLNAWKPREEEEYMAGVRAMGGFRGLEHPWYGSLHRWDTGWFLERIDPKWDFLFTCIPGMMERLKVEPRFGLASDDREGRREAVRFIAGARDAAARLNDACKRRAVAGVAVQSTPKRPAPGVSSSEKAFAESLSEIARWDWMGAEVVVEHCDALVPEHAPDKGFLSLDEELRAVEQAAPASGVIVNWGRSVIETRRLDGPLEHIKRAGRRLRGVMFSGCTESHPLYGAWKDLHTPFRSAFGLPGEPASLMTAEAAAECLRAAAPAAPPFVGFKILPLPWDLPVAPRLECVRASLGFLDRATGN